MLKEKKSRRGTVIALVCTAALLALVIVLENTMKPTGMLFTVLKKGAVYAVVASSMNLLNGFTGLFSLGQAGFMLLGAYTYAILTIPAADREAVYYLYNGSVINFSLPELLAQSDVVSLHCPQTAENARMIDAGALAQMKDGAILLNTARGGLLDEQAVADALRSGKLLAAGMDVVSAEPIRADNPLLTAPNCFLTPHIAWAPLETRRRLQAISAENLRAFLAGKPQNVVNP